MCYEKQFFQCNPNMFNFHSYDKNEEQQNTEAQTFRLFEVNRVIYKALL
jgi:hypothetical protein